MQRWRLVYRSLSEPDCSERPAACHQQCSNLRPSRLPGVISRFRNVRRSHFSPSRAFRNARSAAVLVGLPPPFLVSYDATLRRVAAAWNIVHRQPNGTPSDRAGVLNRPSLRSTQRCVPMWRRDLLASLRPQVALSFPVPLFHGGAAGTAGERIGGGPRPGVLSRLPDACRSTSQTTKRCASATKLFIRPSSFRVVERCAVS